MKKNTEETVLLFNYQDQEKLTKLRALLKGLHVKSIVATMEDKEQTIGYLLGLRGFAKREVAGEKQEFTFPYEFMMFKDITQNRYRQIVEAMRSAEIEVTPCKAVLTPTNRFWSLQKICENLAKEHLSMAGK